MRAGKTLSTNSTLASVGSNDTRSVLIFDPLSNDCLSMAVHQNLDLFVFFLVKNLFQGGWNMEDERHFREKNTDQPWIQLLKQIKFV